MNRKHKFFLVLMFLLIGALSFGSGLYIGSRERRELNQRLEAIEQINDKQTRALFVIAGGLDDLNKQQQLEQKRRELDEKMKELFQKGPAL